ncbi:MAG: 50S ribosomal protein L19 [Candidatus Omnitrophica bacterium]|nr:50S ribosomal protein L19 [Candidatus Omnitrophota bacterium]MDD5488638.1 50S ribosomal protein L19 [Candidatus Omnitrophota bacterium]
MRQQVASLEKKYIKAGKPEFRIGDTVDVHFSIQEGDKRRIQVFGGIVISIKGVGINKNFTVRRISYGEGVERIFPMNSPLLEKVAIKKKGKIRRAKLYYLRGKKGKKATKVREKVEQKNG